VNQFEVLAVVLQAAPHAVLPIRILHSHLEVIPVLRAQVLRESHLMLTKSSPLECPSSGDRGWDSVDGGALADLFRGRISHFAQPDFGDQADFIRA
jgi:hypothetical protein